MKRVQIVGLIGLLVAGIVLQAGVSLAASTTFSGAVETGDLTTIDRIDRNGIVSTCETPTSYPGTIGLFSNFRYDSHTFTNAGASPVCLTVTLTVTSTSPLHPIVYLGSFDPENQAANYLADSGSSASAALGPVTFSFTLAAGQTAVIVLQEVGTDGVPSKAYTLTIAPPDTTPPTVSVPANITVPATGQSGATVTYAVSANDETDGALTPVCDWPSGSLFPVGETSVTCTATDAANNIGMASFTVTVTDAESPVLTVPANFEVNATGPNGAVVTYSASATDNMGVATVTCVPPSGSTFPVGTTTVNCTATDTSNNSVSGSFTVTVLGAGDLLAQLRAGTIDLVTNSSAERALVATVDQAIQAANNGNTWGTYMVLLKYVIQMDRYVDSRAVSPAAAQQLLTQAREVLNTIL